MLLTVKRGQKIGREAVLSRLIDMLYERNDMNFVRGRFRVRGDVVEVYPATSDEEAVRIEFFGDDIECRKMPRTFRQQIAPELIRILPSCGGELVHERFDNVALHRRSNGPPETVRNSGIILDVFDANIRNVIG